MKILRLCSTPAAWVPLASVCLAAMLALAPDAAAQMQMDTRVGFGDTLRLGRWAPVEVSLYNTGGARRGVVYARLTRGGAGREFEYVERVEIPHQGRRAVQFVLPLVSAERAIAVGMRDDDGGSVVEATIDLTKYRTADALVLALSRNADLEFLPSLLERKTAVSYVRPEELPTRWSGLDSAQALVVHNVSLAELEQTRYDALLDWVREGGILVFAGGSSFSVLQGPRERALLPVRVRGIRKLSKLPALPNLPDVPFPAGEWLLIDAVPERGEVLAEAEGLPLIARRGLGLGSIYFLAMDYASARLTGWAGNAALWGALLPLENEAARLDALAEEQDAHSAQHPAAELLKQPLLHFPPRLFVAGFVALYALLAVLLFQLIRSGWGRGWAGWAALGVLVIAATAVAGLWLREPMLHADNAVLTLRTHRIHPGEELGRVIEHAGLFSSRGGPADVMFKESTTVVRAVAELGTASEAPEMKGEPPAGQNGHGPPRVKITREGNTLFWRNLHVPRYSAAVLTMESLAAAPVTLRVAEQSGTTVLTLENLSGRTVVASMVLQRGVLYETGVLRPGETREEDFFAASVDEADQAKPVAETVAAKLPERIGELNAIVPRQLIHRYFRARTLADVNDRLIWMGWIPGDESGLLLEGATQHDMALTLLVAEVEL